MPFRHLGSEGNPEKASSRDEAIGGESHQAGERGGTGRRQGQEGWQVVPGPSWWQARVAIGAGCCKQCGRGQLGQ